MNVSQTIAVSVGTVLFMGLMAQSTGLALAERGDEGGVRLKAKMVSGAASGKAYYQELGNGRRLNLEAANLPSTTQSPKAVFVNGVWVGNVTFAACPIPAQQLLCGAMDLNTQKGQAVPVVTGGQTVQIGLSTVLLAGAF